MNPGKLALLSVNQTLVSNRVAVPPGHRYQILHGQSTFTADGTAATRSWELLLTGSYSVNLILCAQGSITLGVTKNFRLGSLDDDGAASFTDYQRIPPLGYWAESGDFIQMSVTNEQSGDTFNFNLIIHDYVIPRA